MNDDRDQVDLSELNPEQIARLDFEGDKEKLNRTPQLLAVKTRLRAGGIDDGPGTTIGF